MLLDDGNVVSSIWFTLGGSRLHGLDSFDILFITL